MTKPSPGVPSTQASPLVSEEFIQERHAQTARLMEFRDSQSKFSDLKFAGSGGKREFIDPLPLPTMIKKIDLTSKGILELIQEPPQRESNNNIGKSSSNGSANKNTARRASVDPIRGSRENML